MSDLKRLRKLAGILAENEIIPPDDADDMRDREWDERNAREKQVAALIAQAFVRLGLEPQYEFERGRKDYTGVYLDLDDGEAQVTLDDTDVPLSRLAPLMSSGLATDFAVSSNGEGLVQLRFKVAEAILSGNATFA